MKTPKYKSANIKEVGNGRENVDLSQTGGMLSTQSGIRSLALSKKL